MLQSKYIKVRFSFGPRVVGLVCPFCLLDGPGRFLFKRKLLFFILNDFNDFQADVIAEEMDSFPNNSKGFVDGLELTELADASTEKASLFRGLGCVCYANLEHVLASMVKGVTAGLCMLDGPATVLFKRKKSFFILKDFN